MDGRVVIELLDVLEKFDLGNVFWVVFKFAFNVGLDIVILAKINTASRLCFLPLQRP
jgi:hypothetical protein